MAVARSQGAQAGDAGELGAAFAGAVGHDPTAVRLWVSASSNPIELWLLTTSVGAEDERRLYRLADCLYERFPEARFRLHLLNPRMYDELDLDEVLPVDADEIVLHVA